jgi:hypothetical protein
MEALNQMVELYNGQEVNTRLNWVFQAYITFRFVRNIKRFAMFHKIKSWILYKISKFMASSTALTGLLPNYPTFLECQT